MYTEDLEDTEDYSSYDHSSYNPSVLRTAVRTLYDLQKIRIQMGNRIVASFRHKLGLSPGEAEENNPKAKKALDLIRKEYNRITDGVNKITKDIISDSSILTNYGEIKIVESYNKQLTLEEDHLRLIRVELERYAIYTEFLEHVRGVGPAMAGVILSEINIHKCNSIAALWKYCGLDVVVYEKEGIMHEEGRGRKKEHLVEKVYTNRKGESVTTVGITYNAFLKTKMVGVLGSIFIKIGGPYRTVYDDYKNRLLNNPKHVGKTNGHIHNMAIRYAVKMFLADLWTKWRTLEGLPVRASYAEEKLGIKHSGLTTLEVIEMNKRASKSKVSDSNERKKELINTLLELQKQLKSMDEDNSAPIIRDMFE